MKKKFTTYLDEELIEFLKIRAVKEKRSAANILNEYLAELKEKERKED